MAFFFFKSFLLSLILSSLSISLTAAFSDAVVSGTVQRTTKQQILATVLPAAAAATVDATPQPFLVSPSGRYAASFLRGKTALGAGGFGNDFCYVRVEDTSTGQSEWESECAPVTDANACTLAFTDDGLEVFDGSNSVWSTSADGNHVVELMLVDQGDMRIIDKDGELAWKASDDVRANQGCGLPGSEGLAPESPPFAGQIGGGNGNGPFGQPAVAPGAANGQQQQQQQQQQAVGVSPAAALAPVGADAQQQQQQQQGGGDSSVSAVAAPVAVNQQPLDVGGGQGLGFSAQPLVDNSPFDSGSPRELGGSLSAVLGFAAAAALLVHGLLL